jgi:hypothetical protein
MQYKIRFSRDEGTMCHATLSVDGGGDLMTIKLDQAIEGVDTFQLLEEYLRAMVETTEYLPGPITFSSDQGFKVE